MGGDAASVDFMYAVKLASTGFVESAPCLRKQSPATCTNPPHVGSASQVVQHSSIDVAAPLTVLPAPVPNRSVPTKPELYEEQAGERGLGPNSLTVLIEHPHGVARELQNMRKWLVVVDGTELATQLG